MGEEEVLEEVMNMVEEVDLIMEAERVGVGLRIR